MSEGELNNPTAAVLVIGDEILSGRTADVNINTIARFLGQRGIDLKEARIVPDEENEIVAALNALRAKYDYVFTTGGIGPTHDDITADAVAQAFGVPIDYPLEALRILRDFFRELGREETDARLRMARIPEGAELIANPVSKAPGFRIGNVFVLAGVPKVMQAMLNELAPLLKGGRPVKSVSIEALIPEGDLGVPLGEIAARYPQLSIGSYPFYEKAPDGSDRFGAHIVLRGGDEQALRDAEREVRALIETLQRQVGTPPRTWE